MPPRRKSAPAGRVYTSSVPLQQTTLPKSKKRIKSYGKQSTRRAKDDSTLTQIGFIKLKDRPGEEEEYEEEDELEEADYEKAAKKRKTKRRRTAEDQPSATPSWHTQTITQLDWSFSTNNDDEGEKEQDMQEQRSIYDVPSSSPSLPHGKNVRRLAGSAATGPRGESPILGDGRENSPILGNSREASAVLEMPPPPRTPRRIMRQEIPSSQSPATPLSLPPSRRSTRQETPLKEKSINVPIPFNPGRTPHDASKQRPKLEIEDTYESGIGGNTISQIGDVASSPGKITSPAKSVRFALPDEEVDDDDSPASPSIKKESTPYPSHLASQSKVKFEILDSDDEDEDDLEEEILIASLRQDQANNPASIAQEQDNEEVDGPEEEIPIPESIQDQEDPPAENQQDNNPETYYGDIGKETQFEAERIVSSVSERASSNTPEHAREGEQRAVGETQSAYTQRLSTQHLNVMSPRTENSDIFISIHPQHVTNIVNRTKNHEFRTWAIPPLVSRVWIYETKPVASLRYMAKISPAKKPGDILNLDGLGNAEFNAKARAKNYAYEILQLYELADPVPLARMISNGWIKSAPQRFARVGPAVADELVANLKPPLFKDTAGISSSPSTDTQEVEEQLFHTMSQFTSPILPPHHTPVQRVPEQAESMRPQNSIDHMSTPRKPRRPPGPSQAETVDLTQAPTTRPQTQEEEEDEEVIWESPARPVPSSTPSKLPTPRVASDSNGPDSIVPYSMSSSQFLSRSQLLPESLLNEDVPGPPRFVHDSDYSDDEL